METVLQALAIYFALLMMTRISGRRTLSQIKVFDFVLVLLIAETSQNALVGDDGSITNALVLVATLVITDVFLSYAKSHAHWIALLIDGTPTVLMRHGNLETAAMLRARVSVEDILQSARTQHGLMQVDDISYAVLETSGNISIIPHGQGKEK
jgi:uncharacterized membrane protein YcaP (DUF421 family)